MIIVWTMRRQAVAVHCLLAVTFLCWGSVNGVCESVEATTGFLYSCELAGNDFPAASSTGSGLEYSVALAGHPGLPAWLDVLQSDSSSPGYLYGTPGSSDVGSVTLQITALDELSFATERKSVEVTVASANGEIILALEFYLTNYNTEEFLSPSVLQQFSDVLVQVFPGTSPGITHVIHPSTRGISVPAPPSKHGVFVVVTPGVDVDEYLAVSTEEATAVQGQCSSEEQFDLPPASLELFADSNFTIDWCQFTVDRMSEGEGEEVVGTAGDDSFVSRPSTEEGSVLPLVVIVVVCAVLLLTVLVVLACVLLGGRKQALYKPRQRRLQKAAVLQHARETSSRPKAAQQYLRDLAQTPRRRAAGVNAGDEELVLANGGVAGDDGGQLQEVLELTGLGSQAPGLRQREPPPYTYPQDLLRQSLQSLAGRPEQATEI